MKKHTVLKAMKIRSKEKHSEEKLSEIVSGPLAKTAGKNGRPPERNKRLKSDKGRKTEVNEMKKMLSLIMVGMIIATGLVGLLSLTSESAEAAGLADSPWPMFHGNLRHTGLSPYDTSGNTGTLKWKYQTEYWVDSSPAIGSDGTIYAGSYDDYTYAINPDGTLKWRYQTGGGVVSSPAIGSDGTIYVGSADNYTYAINPDGTLKWRYQTGGGVVSSPAIGSDGTIYVGSADNYTYAINPDGTLKWRYQTGGGVVSSPAIGSDGTIYVGSYDDYLYALGGSMPVTNIIYQKILNWDVYKDAYNFGNPATEWSSGGNCYGTSATEILYYEHYIKDDSSKPYFPYQEKPKPKCTYDLKLPTHVWSNLNNNSLAITIHQVFQGYDIDDSPNSLAGMDNITVVRNNKKINLFYGIPSETNLKENFEFINDSLSSGKPVIMVLLPTKNQIGTEYERDAHAVVVWGIEIYDDSTVKIFISDPNEPNRTMFAYYWLNSNTFRYAPGELDPENYLVSNPKGIPSVDENGRHHPNWEYFGAVSPTPMKKDWFFHGFDWLVRFKRYLCENEINLKHYNFVVGTKFLLGHVKIVEHDNHDQTAYFEEVGNSQTFSTNIPGVVGISEGYVQLFAIPKNIAVDVDPAASGFSSLWTFTVENTTMGTEIYAYLLNMSGDHYNYDIEISNLTQGISLKPVNGSIDLDLTVMHVDSDGPRVLNATDLLIDDGHKALFEVKDWGKLNSTKESSVHVDVYNGDKKVGSYDLKNGQSGLASSGNTEKSNLSQYWWIFIILGIVIIAVIAVVLLRKRPRTHTGQRMGEQQPPVEENTDEIPEEKDSGLGPPPPEY